MPTVIRLTEGNHFEATLSTGYRMEIDAGEDHGGTGQGARPMELLLTGLAGCTGVDIVDIMGKARQEMTGLEITVSGKRAEDWPKVFTHIKVHYQARGRNISEEALKRAIHLSETKYCSALAMLRSTAEVESSYEIIEG